MAKVSKDIAFTVVVKHARLSFAWLFTPEKNPKTGYERYKGSFLLDPSIPESKAQLVSIKAEIDKLWRKMCDLGADAKAPRDKTALKNGNDKTYDGYKDMWYISAARAVSQGKPELIVGKDPTGKPIYLADNDARLYSGRYVHAKLRFYGQWREDSGFRINCSIEAVQPTLLDGKKGDPFGAGKASVDDMPDSDDAPDEDNLDSGGGGGLDDGDDGL